MARRSFFPIAVGCQLWTMTIHQRVRRRFRRLVTPLDATLTADFRVLAEITRSCPSPSPLDATLTRTRAVTPLSATLTKNQGRGDPRRHANTPHPHLVSLNKENKEQGEQGPIHQDHAHDPEPPARSYPDHLAFLSAAARRRRRLADRPGLSPSYSPRTHARTRPRGRHLLCSHRRATRRLRGQSAGWRHSPRMESPPAQSQRLLGLALPRRSRQSRRRHHPSRIAPQSPLQRGHDGRPRSRRQRRPHRHLRLARTQRHQIHHRRFARLRTSRCRTRAFCGSPFHFPFPNPFAANRSNFRGKCRGFRLLYFPGLLYFLYFLSPLRSRRIHGCRHRAAIGGSRSAHRSRSRRSQLRQPPRSFVRLRRTAQIAAARQNAFRALQLDIDLSRRKSRRLSRRRSFAGEIRSPARFPRPAHLRRRRQSAPLPPHRNDLRRSPRPQTALESSRRVPHRGPGLPAGRISPPRPELLR